jgi:1,4-alpha-glucan branching enzyme
LRHDVSEGAFSMLRKVYSQTGKKCRVTFEFLPEAPVQTAYVCGEFNDWSTSAHPMKRRKDGTFTTMFWVEAGRAYRFRYLLDGEQWRNDPAADGYTSNPYGGDDSLLKV